MKSILYRLVQLIIVLIIIQSAHAHRAGLSFVEIEIKDHYWWVAIEFDRDDVRDQHFLTELDRIMLNGETNVEQENIEFVNSLVQIDNRKTHGVIDSISRNELQNTISLKLRLNHQANDLQTLYFPIIEKFSHSHRQFVTVSKNSQVINQQILGGHKQPIMLKIW